MCDQTMIYAPEHTDAFLREMSNQKKFFCPECSGRLVFRQCRSGTSHFAHLHKNCSYPFREAESVEHESGKHLLFRWASNLFTQPIKMEEKIQQTGQRSDVLLYHDTGPVAFEFQCSPIKKHTWEYRHRLYQEAGVLDLWILGYSMHTRPYAKNKYFHKLNELEKSILHHQHKIVYFDVASNYFIFLYPETEEGTFLSPEFFLSAKECHVDFQQGTITHKYEKFLMIQKKRFQIATDLQAKANESDLYLQTLKDGDGSQNVTIKTKEKENEKANEREEQRYKDEKKIAKKALATHKQIKYIQFLLSQKNMVSPYKFHGLLKEEAQIIIKKLKS